MSVPLLICRWRLLFFLHALPPPPPSKFAAGPR